MYTYDGIGSHERVGYSCQVGTLSVDTSSFVHAQYAQVQFQILRLSDRRSAGGNIEYSMGPRPSH